MSSSSCLLLSSWLPKIKKETFPKIRSKKDASTSVSASASASASFSVSCKLKPAPPPRPLILFFNSNSAKRKIVLVRSRTETGSGTDSDPDLATLVGEDSAAFDLKNQKLTSWLYFSVILGVVLFLLQLLWIDSSTGYGKAFIDSVSSLSDSHEVSYNFFFDSGFQLINNDLICIYVCTLHWPIINRY